MNTIELNEINFSNLKKLTKQGTLSTILRDESNCYKFMKNLSKTQLKHLRHKIEYFSKLDKNHFLVPENIILKNGDFVGYTMKYFDDSTDLYNKYTTSTCINCAELNSDLIKSSKALREFHDKGFVFLDMSFSNILKNSKGEIKLCDFDGSIYDKKIDLPITSQILNDYVEYKNEKIKVNPNTDRLSLLLSMYVALFKREITDVKEEEYDYLADRIRSLKILKFYYKTLLDKKENIPNIPYLDLLLCEDDNAIIKYQVSKEKVLVKCEK